MIFFWAMAPIAAKYIAGWRPAEAFDVTKLGTISTGPNWNTVLRLLELAQE